MAHLSLKDERQQTHYIVPGDNQSLIEKALNFGCSRAEELLSRYSITLEELAQKLNTTPETITGIIQSDFHPDLILIDGEDATVANPENILQARKNAIGVFTQRSQYVSRVYYRPSGMELDYCIDDLVDVVSAIPVLKDKSFPLDGIIYPKVEDKEEISIILGILSDLEKEKKLPEGTIKFQFLIESARGVENLYEIGSEAINRLTGIIFGMADYASDAGVSSLNENHPMFQWVKQKIINAGAALGVPAVDCMSFQYPVANKQKDIEYNHDLILNRIKEVHDIAIDSFHLGMRGKWTGHPLQLLAVKIAVEKIFSADQVNIFVEKARKYSGSATGATMIHGQMADRATDRAVRSYLRLALVKGKLELADALSLGVISEKEAQLLNTTAS